MNYSRWEPDPPDDRPNPSVPDPDKRDPIPGYPDPTMPPPEPRRDPSPDPKSGRAYLSGDSAGHHITAWK
jgi:hypothetical protein